MIEKILIFIIFLCPLVFFHELGHFIFARIFGVRVEVFSIGFGPKILKYNWKGTQYAISIIPLGGYVKMFGDDPMNKESIPPEERGVSFTYKNKWAKFWIVMGGPLANFVLAYFIFVSLLVHGERLPEVKFGQITTNSVFYSKGIRTGDVIKKIDGHEIMGASDVPMEDDQLVKEMTLERGTSTLNVAVDLPAKEFFEEFFKNPPVLRLPVFVDKNSTMWVATTQEGKVDWSMALEQIQDRKNEGMLYLYQVKDLEKKEVDLQVTKQVGYQALTWDDLANKLVTKGFYPLDLMIKSVNMRSPADQAGLKGGDVMATIDNKIVTSFEGLKSALQEIPENEAKLSVWREGKLLNVVVVPEVAKQEGKDVKLIGVYSSGDYQDVKFIQTEGKSFLNSLYLGFGRTWDTIAKTALSFKKLITNEMSLRNIGGPLAIGKVAADSFNTGLTYFFQVMALISVNLGVINLFPIPVLDGGHIMFILLELINRGPLSRRKMEIAQQFGLSLLLILTFAALYNDFSRFF